MSKFGSDRDEALYHLTLDGGSDAQSGSVDSPSGWFAALHLTTDELVEYDGLSVTVPAGDYMIRENSDGMVMVDKYGDPRRLKREFGKREAAYIAWLDEEWPYG